MKVIFIFGLVVVALITLAMTKNKWVKVALAGAIPLTLFAVYLATGSGGFKRAITMSGIVPILRPGGYEVVCFIDADGNDGGMFCLPCDEAKCRK